MTEGTIWFSTFYIIFTIWMNKQAFFSNFTIGKHFEWRDGVVVRSLFPILAGRPVLAAL